MIKFRTTLAVLILAGSLSISCRKCLECTYTKASETKTEKSCGGRSEQENFERKMRDEGIALGVTTHCEKIKK